ncbi:MAG: secretin N-terminal domain-containing protein [Planctomycetota bacterium]|jgi:general secretion pathway protein D
MIAFAEPKWSMVLAMTLLLTSLGASEDAMTVSFDPFGSDESETLAVGEEATDTGPVIPEIRFAKNEISMAFQIISDVTGWSIFPTEKVSTAKVSLWARDITAKELLDAVVKLAGFIYHRQGDVISVMTYDEFMQHYGLTKKVVAFTYADAVSVAAVIDPFLTELGTKVVHQETNTIVLYETEANLKTIADIMQKLDTPAENIRIEVIGLRYAQCDSLAPSLQQAFATQKKMTNGKHSSSVPTPTPTPSRSRAAKSGQGGGSKRMTASLDMVGIFAVSHANQLIIVGTRADVQKVKDIVTMIDVYGDSMVLEVIDLKFADAERVAATLQEVFSPKKSSDNTGSITKSNQSVRQPPEAQVIKTSLETQGMLFSPQAQVLVHSIGRTNQLIARAFRNDIEKLKRLVEKLDVFVEPTTKNYHFVYVNVSEIHQSLERILEVYGRYGRSYQGAGVGAQTGSRGYGGDSGVTLVERTNSILLTGPPSAHRIMESIYQSVDVPGTYEAGMIRVYKIQNADVDEIAATIQTLLESRTEAEEKRGEAKVQEKVEAEAGPGPEMTESEEFVPQVEAKVSANKATNSVIVQATARQHRELEKLIKELDVRRKQVFIKATIIEVATTDDLDLGVELDYINGDLISFTSYGLSTIDLSTGIRDVIVSPGGTAAVLRPNKVQAILKALQGNDNVRIESAPQILVNDNAVGMIQSIAEEPTRETNLGETTTTTSFGEYVTAGTQFNIIPHISESNYLRVEYNITLNSFGEKADPTLPPSRNTSTIQSEATVPDGYTIVVGGIQASNESESVDKVPLLGDIPLLGLAFRNTIIRKQYITTYLFITTTIMKSEGFDDLKDASKQALETVREDGKGQPFNQETENLE